MSDNLFDKWALLEHKYTDRDIMRRLLMSVGANVEIVVYRNAEGEIENVSLENTDTGSVILDFDIDGGDL
jgi:hypothetical protein